MSILRPNALYNACFATTMITREQAVRRLAYRLWEERGRPLGSPEIDWFHSEDLLSAERYSRPGVRGSVPLPPGFSRPPFLGYLAPLTEGCLLELVNTSRVNHPERLPENRTRFESARYSMIESLFRLWKKSSHAEAERTVLEASKAGKPLCLYLRNFDLGTRAAPAKMFDEIGNPLIVSSTSSNDRLMQVLLKQVVQPVMPVVGIENQAGDAGEIDHFRVRAEHWEELASTLIRHAGIIVFFFLELTPGVKQEIELIRRVGKQTHSLIVFGKQPYSGMESLFGVKGGQAREIRGFDLSAEFPDFPLRVNMSQSEEPSQAEA